MCRTADAEMYMHQFMEAARRLVSCAAAAPLLLCRCCLAGKPLPVSIAATTRKAVRCSCYTMPLSNGESLVSLEMRDCFYWRHKLSRVPCCRVESQVQLLSSTNTPVRLVAPPAFQPWRMVAGSYERLVPLVPSVSTCAGHCSEVPARVYAVCAIPASQEATVGDGAVSKRLECPPFSTPTPAAFVSAACAVLEEVNQNHVHLQNHLGRLRKVSYRMDSCFCGGDDGSSCW